MCIVVAVSLSVPCVVMNEMFNILNENDPKHIQIFGTNFNALGSIATRFENIKVCDVDMCLFSNNSLKHTILVSTSVPFASVRLLDKEQGILWRLDDYSSS